MESVLETPPKRRKTDADHSSGLDSYSSQDDSGNNLIEDFAHETVATVPLSHHGLFQQPSSGKVSSSFPYITQPTQPINKKDSEKPSIVQVAASSPIRSGNEASPVPNMGRRPGGILARSIAPAGTSFRPPAGIIKPPVIDLSDDEGPIYRGGSSDDEVQKTSKVDIKPSTFIQAAQRLSGALASKDSSAGSSKSAARFKEITSGSFYKPIENKFRGSNLSGSVYDSRNRDENQTTSKLAAPNQSADVMANAYGGFTQYTKQVRQTGPAKARLTPDISLNEIADYQLRRKVERMQVILPRHSILALRNALLAKKANIDDAIDMLASQEDQFPSVSLTTSDNNQQPNKSLNQNKVSSKQRVKAPVQTIQERWAAAQALKGIQPATSSPPEITPLETPPKPRRRLVQGRKRPLSPPNVSSRIPSERPVDLDDSDSGIGPELEGDVGLELDVQNFLNTCSVPDLVDISGIAEGVATSFLSQTPFKSLAEARQITHNSVNQNKKTSRKVIGDKIVERCLDMWTGYGAVDSLVRQCEALAQPVADEMKKWGVDLFGTAKAGELELATFDDISSGNKSQGSLRDSGIGTPTSIGLSADENSDVDAKRTPPHRNKNHFFPQPKIMGKGVILKDYQIVGVNWLSLLFEKELSCILADDMGLGKTCQVIAFLAHLLEKGIKGPHVVVVPGSTIENWLREFSIFCPDLAVMPYYASLKERMEVREQIEENLVNINVIVTTYGMAKRKEDNKFIRRLKPIVCVYDEGHILKNSKSAGYTELMRIPARFRLLLTGTPLQNNLCELASLLGFILPAVFREHRQDLEYIFSHKARTTDESHAALLSTQRIARAKSMMAPFVLRRKKHQVLKHLPKKTRRVEYCDMSQSQIAIYEQEKAKAVQVIEDRAAGKKGNNDTANIMMALRKASMHPLLFRRLYTDEILSKMSKACLGEEEFCQSNVDLVYEDMTVMTDYELHSFCERYPSTMSAFPLRHDEWMDSGKVTKLCELLRGYQANGDRVLIFSQFVMMMNILEAVLETLHMRFFRLDGGTKIDERQDMIDQFHAEPAITAFLLSTKAGGAGINLACANKVIIFDSSFNPQDDIQAENRAHRVGQTREVDVVRLVTRHSIEEQIHALGETKLALDDRVAAAVATDVVQDELDDRQAERRGQKAVEEMMVKQMTSESGRN